MKEAYIFLQILDRYYPEFATSRPSVGRVGKSRRRRKARQSAMEPDEHPPLTEDIAMGQDFGDEDTCNETSVHSSERSSFEQQVARFEEYVRPVLELFSLPPLPVSELRSVWTEVAPYQVSSTSPILYLDSLCNHCPKVHFHVTLAYSFYLLKYGYQLCEQSG